ncbi:VanZ family protein [Caldibacillus lycopersici]|uniref:VanZ family protein n=1 Tax=Perspicuibacillus lycopersici TaxID=1325689 RepID=A0AAE3IWD2_9BACI|nr:VanZ family protein [Perspicuibacillus lycopersici]MCU9613290.1 VanZ family protein [Perspicuibacillus lycopersici]
MKKLLWFLVKLAPVLYMGLIWTLSSFPSDAVVTFNVADTIIKESLHLIEFAILYVLLVLFFLVDGKLTKRINLSIALFACFYGLLDEIHQYFVPSRTSTVIDLIKDVTGVAICYWVVYRGYLLKKNTFGNFLASIEKLFSK